MLRVALCYAQEHNYKVHVNATSRHVGIRETSVSRRLLPGNVKNIILVVLSSAVQTYELQGKCVDMILREWSINIRFPFEMIAL